MTAQASGISVEILILNIHYTPIGPHMPSPHEILHNRTQECPEKLPKAVAFKKYEITS